MIVSAPVSTHLALRRNILGVYFHDLTLVQAVDLIESYIADRQPMKRVTFANAYTLAFTRNNPELQDLINTSDLTLADGMSIVWAGRWIGVRLPERVAGPDVTDLFCARASQKRYRIFLMGSSEDTLQKMSAVLQKRWPGLIICGTHSPSICDRFSDAENEEICRRINETHPDILFVGLSAPKQEIWLAKNAHRLSAPAALAIGAAFDFISGKIPRAPQKIRRIGLEWLYRLYCEPRRLWKRYLLGNAVFLSDVVREIIRQHVWHRSS